MIYKFIFFVFMCNTLYLSGNDSAEKTQPDSPPLPKNNNENELNGCKNPKKNCSDLDVACITCPNFTNKCIYGEFINITCSCDKIAACDCLGEKSFQKTVKCRYCYQTERWEHSCEPKNHCLSVASPPQYYKTNCTVHRDIICLGSRTFLKKLRCNWTRGHKWSTALILSITLGGFGADRFYLGHWQEGIGKLFSFGGLGVWTLVDVLLITIRYLGPADGSFYV